MRKRCDICGRIRPVNEFAWQTTKRRRDNRCISCRKAYQREHYLKNRKRYIANAGERRRGWQTERLIWLLEYFKEHPCVDCGETDPVILEFDHLSDKSFNIGTQLGHRKWPDILDEIRKCEVVCANCHVRRTARRVGSIRHLLASQPRQRMLFF